MKFRRFYDRVMSDKRVPSDLKVMLDGVPVIDCQSICRFYYEESDQEFWTTQDFPNVAPAFPVCWLDFHAPSKIVSRERGISEWGTDRPSAWGILVTGEILNEETLPHYLNHPTWKQDIPNLFAYLDQAKWGVDFSIWYERQGKIHTQVWELRFLVRENGEVVCALDDPLRLVCLVGTKDGEIRAALQGWQALMGASYPEALHWMFDQFSSFFHLGCFALSFMHCKNIRLEDREPQAAHIPRSKKARRRGDKAYQPVPYKVLVIDPMREVLQKEGRSHEVGMKQALHLVRGHFAHYSDEKKLFGKYTGTFWRPLHVKGTTQKGVVTKDYKLADIKQQKEKEQS